MPPEIRIVESLSAIDAEAWNRCFPGELENYAYLRSVEDAALPGFQFCYAVLMRESELSAAMPGFLTDYSLDTTLTGRGKKISEAMRQLFPNLMTLKLACLGSPGTEYGRIGFHPSVAETGKSEMLSGLLDAFEHYAVSRGYRLVGLKDIPAFEQPLWDAILCRRNYRGVAGLPVAKLPIDFATTGSYLERLSPSTRKDMRRKLRSLDHIRIVERREIGDVLAEIIALYRQTRERAEMQFEELTPAFFSHVLEAMAGRAFFQLFYHGDRLLAANLLLRDDQTLLDKFFFMDGSAGREHNLYFLSWFTNVEYCLLHGLKFYQSGQAGYDNKLRLGSGLIKTTNYFKHKNRLIHRALRLAAPLLAADQGMKEAA